MEILIAKNYEEMSKLGYDVIKKVVTSKPNAILGLATGGTPVGLYKNMIEDCKNGVVSYKDISTINLDEYLGLDGNDNQSYRYFMNTNLFDHIDIDKKNTYLPNGKAEDRQAECERYSKLADEMQQDVQILGIGSNGHIAFNEPGTAFDSRTHVVDLTENTIKDNARFFDKIEDVPTQAFTMGISNIVNAKKILLLASGANKADAIYQTIKGTPSENCPASALQNHPDVIFVLDEAAASKL